jgi:hypothetical protein
MSTRVNIDNNFKVLRSTNKNEYPTAIVIRELPNGGFQWWGNDNHPYSPVNNNIDVLINLATINGLQKI